MRSKVRFITIGYVEWRKGQDVLVDAIEMLPSEYTDKAEYLIVGQDTSFMAQNIRKRTDGIANIDMTGTVSRDEIHKLLNECDMMICPSREDSMPTVCAEAMMHSLPCIVSDATGTSEYITDGYDGMIFLSESAKDLSEKIQLCIEHKDELHIMGERAHEIYERIFSGAAFERSLMSYIEDALRG